MKKFLPGITFVGLLALSVPGASASVDISMTAFGSTYAEPGQEYQFYSQVNNKGSEPVSSLTYTQIIEGYEDKSFTVEFDPIDAISKRYVRLTAVAPDEEDVTKSLKLQVTAVNGVEITPITVSGKVVTSSFVPVHKAIVEDYTGTWCGYCPRGTVALGGIRRDYSESVLGIAYHSGDAMAVATFSAPQETWYAPTIRVNRNTDNPEAAGTASTAGQSAVRGANTLANASVTIESCEWLDEEHSQAYVKASVEFANLVTDGECQIEFALIENGLTGTTNGWRQSNYFAGASAEWSDPLWDPFINGSSTVSGLTFDDVCIANTLKDNTFISSIPSTEGRTKIYFEYTFNDVNKIKEYGSAKYILQNPDQCHIAAIVSNSSSRAVVNCDWAHVDDASGIVGVTADDAVDASVEKEYFTISGVKVSSDNLTPGLYIVRQGKKTSKVVIR